MSNEEIAKILSNIATYLEMDGVPFKPRAYEKVADLILEFREPLSELYKKGGLKAIENIPGVGAHIGEKIEELLKTGKLCYYEKLKKKTPVDLASLLGVQGLGPKHIKKFYEELHIKNTKDLERAARAGKIAGLSGFGKKSEENILKGVDFLKKSGGRFVLAFAMPNVLEVKKSLETLKEVQRIDVAGSIRRGKETVGDADILVIAKNPKSVMDCFVALRNVKQVLAHGVTKSAVILNNGMEVQLRVVPMASYGAALNYFTGSKDHNVALRQMAIKRGWKLNEYGLFSGKRQIAGKTEEDLYKALGMIYVPPELRENTGEIRAALHHKLPDLIPRGSLRGDLQVQTSWSDGSNSIEEMARTAMKTGLEYIAITDHTKRLKVARGLDEKRIQMQWNEIDHINQKLKTKNPKFKILKGTECDILAEGSLDLPDKILSKLDVVGVSVHSLFKLSREEQTKRIQRAMENPHVDIFFHPTGRIIQSREPYDVDIDEIIRVAKKTGTILEIDAYPVRADLKDEYVKKCVEAGVKMSIDSDAHAPEHFAFLEYGITQAKRGWATKTDIVNTLPVEKMLKNLKGK
ncbi:MAG: DNA polymerase/3'-5' exonuclease PolX [Candidatus Liptonbacteria bacterium]|nr:DNA polymerase/3'-5' exonuclease PolX [Candidatus Liptonbacteria bacterium]